MRGGGLAHLYAFALCPASTASCVMLCRFASASSWYRYAPLSAARSLPNVACAHLNPPTINQWHVEYRKPLLIAWLSGPTLL